MLFRTDRYIARMPRVPYLYFYECNAHRAANFSVIIKYKFVYISLHSVLFILNFYFIFIRFRI